MIEQVKRLGAFFFWLAKGCKTSYRAELEQGSVNAHYIAGYLLGLIFIFGCATIFALINRPLRPQPSVLKVPYLAYTAKIDSLCNLSNDTLETDSTICLETNFNLGPHHVHYVATFKKRSTYVHGMYRPFSRTTFEGSSLKLDNRTTGNLHCALPGCLRQEPLYNPLLIGPDGSANVFGNQMQQVVVRADTFYVLSLATALNNTPQGGMHYFLILNFRTGAYALLPFLHEYPLGFAGAPFGDFDHDGFLDGYLYYQTRDCDEYGERIKGFFLPVTLVGNVVRYKTRLPVYAYVYDTRYHFERYPSLPDACRRVINFCD